MKCLLLGPVKTDAKHCSKIPRNSGKLRNSYNVLRHLKGIPLVFSVSGGPFWWQLNAEKLAETSLLGFILVQKGISDILKKVSQII